MENPGHFSAEINKVGLYRLTGLIAQKPKFANSTAKDGGVSVRCSLGKRSINQGAGFIYKVLDDFDDKWRVASLRLEQPKVGLFNRLDGKSDNQAGIDVATCKGWNQGYTGALSHEHGGRFGKRHFDLAFHCATRQLKCPFGSAERAIR